MNVNEKIEIILIFSIKMLFVRLVLCIFQAFIASSIKKDSVIIDRSRCKFSCCCLQLLYCLHLNVHNTSALAADIVIMWGCVIIKMVRAVTAGEFADFAKLD